MEFLILFICLGFLYLLFKPSRKLKTKEQKQAEIFDKYKEELRAELEGLDGENLKNKKMILLKKIAEELNRNLFFDENETRKLIQKLIDGK